MKVLITGGAGYIGVMLTSHLLLQGFDVVVFDKCLFGSAPLLPFSNQKFRLIQGDIRDRSAFRSAMQGVHAVVHMAALVGEDACALDAEATRAINLKGTEIALSLSKECGVEKFVFISTCSTYGVSLPNALTDETSPLRPLTEYAVTKVSAEQLAFEQDSTLSPIVLRFGTICGLSPQMRFDLLINDLARAVALNLPIKIFAPNAWRPFLHIKDAARAIERCLTTPKEKVKSNVFNVVSENYQKGELAKLALRHFPESQVEVLEKSSDPRDYRVSAERIRDELGFIPAYTIEQAFLETTRAVKERVFLNPLWPGYSAVPRSVDSIQFI